MIWLRRGVGLVLAAGALFLSGCAHRPPLLESPSRAIELAETPFFPQLEHQCGPAALATVLGASEVPVSPEQLVPRVYLPGRRGSLQVELQAAPRAFGRLAYRIEPELSAITAELDAGRPVLVLHNYGLPFWPRWHYAVVVGYDGAQQRLMLRSGTERRQLLSAANFMRAWDNADRWALVMLKPGELPASAEPSRYLESAAAFEGAADPDAAWRAFDAAAKRWPEQPVAWTGRGTASFRRRQFQAAVEDYQEALRINAALPAVRNNLAMALLELGCPAQAAQELATIEGAALDEALRREIADTRRQIESRPPGTCAAH